MKRLLALLLTVVMLFGLVACGEKDADPTDKAADEQMEDTVPTEPVGSEPQGTEPDDVIPEPPVALGDVALGISVADVDALLKIFLNEDPGLDVENIYFQMGASDEEVLLSLGAAILGSQHDVHLIAGEALILAAPTLLRENYGISMEALAVLMESATADYDTGMPELDPELAAALILKYYNLLIEEVKKASGVTVTANGGNSVINGTLDSDAVSVVLIELVEVLCQDDDFFALMAATEGVTPEEFKEDFLYGKPEKEELLEELKHFLALHSVALEITGWEVTADNAPVAGKAKLTLNQNGEDDTRPAEFGLDFDIEAGTFSVYLIDEGVELFGVEIGNGALDARYDIDDERMHLNIAATGNGISGVVEMCDEKIMEMEVSVTDTDLDIRLVISRNELTVNVKNSESDIVGTLCMDGEEMGKVTFDKLVEGSKTTLLLKTLEISGNSIDFSSAGIGLYVDTDAQLPTASDYRDVTQMTEEDLNAVLDQFLVDNEALVNWFYSIFSGGADDLPQSGAAA